MSETVPQTAPEKPLVGRPRLSEAERRRRAEEHRKRSWQGGVSVLSWNDRREDAEGERHFAARDRFDLRRLHGDAVPPVMDAVRPVDFLKAFRCDPSPSPDGRQTRVLTAGDQLLLEVLVSAARSRHLSLEYQTASVPVSAVLAVVRMPDGRPHDEKWVRKAMHRLATTECVLPGLRRPATRMTRGRRLALSQAPDDMTVDEAVSVLEYRTVANLLHPTLRHGSVEPDPTRKRIRTADAIGLVYKRRAAVAAAMDRAAVAVATSREERRRLASEAHRKAVAKVGDAYAIPDELHPETVMVRDQPPEREFDWFGASVHRERRFVPVVRWVIADGEIHFELARWMRHWLNGFRKIDHLRAPWALVDLRQMSRFTSPYTAPLYRRLVAETYDPTTRNALYDEKIVELPIREVAEIVGHRPQGGGLFSEMNRTFLKRVAADLEGMGGRISIRWLDAGADPKTIDRTVLRFRVRAPLDVGRMRSAHDWLLPNGKRVKPSRDDLAALAPFDQPSLTVKAIDWMKIVNRLKLDRETAMRLSQAWRLALDEAMHHGQQFFGDLTGNADLRKIRGLGLVASRNREGIAAAAFRFCVEELASPDLSDVDMLDMLVAEQVVQFAEDDRTARYHHSENKAAGEPRRVERHMLAWDRVTTRVEMERRRAERELDRMVAETVKAEEAAERSKFFRERKRDEPRLPDDTLLDAFDGQIYVEIDGVRQEQPILLPRFRREAVEMDRWRKPIRTAADLRLYLASVYVAIESRTALFVMNPDEDGHRRTAR